MAFKGVGYHNCVRQNAFKYEATLTSHIPGSRVDCAVQCQCRSALPPKTWPEGGLRPRTFLYNLPFCNCNQAITTDSGYISHTKLYAKHMAISEIVIVYIFIIVCE